MKRIALHSAVAIAALGFGVASAAEITIYKQPNFGGQELTLRGTRDSLSGSGFYDQASSAVVRSGRWQLCTQPDFQGECLTLGPGEYAQLDPRVFHRVESMRLLESFAYNEERSFPRGDRYYDRGYGYRRGDVELFAGTGYRGPRIRLNDDRQALGDDRYGLGISSLVVNDGTWQLCTRPGYRGDCEVYEPGSYPDIGRMNNRVASIRRIG